MNTNQKEKWFSGDEPQAAIEVSTEYMDAELKERADEPEIQKHLAQLLNLVWDIQAILRDPDQDETNKLEDIGVAIDDYHQIDAASFYDNMLHEITEAADQEIKRLQQELKDAQALAQWWENEYAPK